MKTVRRKFGALAYSTRQHRVHSKCTAEAEKIIALLAEVDRLVGVDSLTGSVPVQP